MLCCDPDFLYDVGAFVRENASDYEKACLKDFFYTLRTKGIQDYLYDGSLFQYVIARCGFLVEITEANDGFVVTDIRRPK